MVREVIQISDFNLSQFATANDGPTSAMHPSVVMNTSHQVPAMTADVTFAFFANGFHCVHVNELIMNLSV
jgi:hypothetical protein